MYKKLLLLSIVSTLTLSAEHNHHSYIESPVGVHGEHVHEKGSFMFELSYMDMNMNGNILGATDVSTAEVQTAGYALVPETMNMKMKMLHAMYSISDSLAVMAMLPYADNEMLMSNDALMTSQGLGDIGVSFTYLVQQSHKTELLFTARLNLPTGSIENYAPNSTTTLAPYPMQLGSGSYAFIPTATYLFKQKSYVVGSQIEATVYLNENERAYTLGNKYMAQAWLAYAPLTNLALSARFQFNANENISGKDVSIPTMTPTGDPLSQAYQNLLNYYGCNYSFSHGFLKGQTLGFEYGVALYQNAENIHMKWENSLHVSWELIL